MNPFCDERIPADARALVIVGVVIGAAFAGLLVLFVGGEILSDPGGGLGLAIVVAWLALPLLLSILALWRPRVACPVLVAVVGLVLLASLATIPLAAPVWEFEDMHGPINLLVLIGALIPLIVLGRSMPWEAGWLLIATIAGSLLLQGVSLGLVGQWSVIIVFAVLMPPFIAAAVLFVLAGWRARRDSSPQPTG